MAVSPLVPVLQAMDHSVVTAEEIHSITAAPSTVAAVPLAEAAMEPAVPLAAVHPIARATMAAVHSVAEDS